MLRRCGPELLLIALAFLTGLAAAAWLESMERAEQEAAWLEEGR